MNKPPKGSNISELVMCEGSYHRPRNSARPAAAAPRECASVGRPSEPLLLSLCFLRFRASFTAIDPSDREETRAQEF